jgi:hypothetical protein
MANKKNTITRAQALESALYLVNLAINETANTENSTNWAEVAEVLDKMHASITKPRAKQDGPTKTQRENLKLAQDMRAAIEEHGAPVNSKWVTEHVHGILTSQKVTAVAKVAIANGWIVKEKEGKTVTYSIA